MTEEELKAIETLEHWVEYEKANKDKINKADELIQVQETILNLIEKQQKEIENSVSKEKIEEYLKEAEEKYQVYKKGVKDNEALKSGMWKHLGEVDVLKRILGKQRNVVTLDNKLLGE